MVKVECYNKIHEFKTITDAIVFFRRCYFSSEGSEQQRYASILMQLYDNKTNVSDEYYE